MSIPFSSSPPSGKGQPLSHAAPDLVCLSHLGWGFVYQRPQHLLSRCAQSRRVFFVEEPQYGATTPRMDVRVDEASGVHVCVPHLRDRMTADEQTAMRRMLLDGLLASQSIREYVMWIYTPMALQFSRHLFDTHPPLATVYDCMDELAAFKFAPVELQTLERELFRRAEVVFTGGWTLYESKTRQHRNVHAFPSSVDVPHFAQARTPQPDPADQAAIPHPRAGFCGVIDERMNLELLDSVAAALPEWQFVMIGPVVKIDMSLLPQRSNIHYVGGKSYQELPAYFSGWDVGLLPFAHNESTRFISPTKTPEYLAAGLPVVSTSIRDVVRPYGEKKLVRIADTVEEFAAAVVACHTEDKPNPAWRMDVDAHLAALSWDLTWAGMWSEIEAVLPQQASREEQLAGAGTVTPAV